ncbi:MAG: NADH-quinone oxidoreductase subunit I [Chloroflexi bacterium]|nr:NADH-quinone oxidoreductase subunit I [Chloroflexota bacterium]MBI4504051.1 NADH-quinone oxidoreductase subunit I [Chloroflexota bacterium]
MLGVGGGIARSMLTTLRQFFRPAVTVQYPEEKLPLKPRSRAALGFDEDICIKCAQCARACPLGLVVMRVSRGPDGERVLDQYDIDLTYCLNCGLCVEDCPTGAIHWTPRYELAAYRREDLIFTRERWRQETLARRKAAAVNRPLLIPPPWGPVTGRSRPLHPLPDMAVV